MASGGGSSGQEVTAPVLKRMVEPNLCAYRAVSFEAYPVKGSLIDLFLLECVSCRRSDRLCLVTDE